jgi:hypothetical protein
MRAVAKKDLHAGEPHHETKEINEAEYECVPLRF